MSEVPQRMAVRRTNGAWAVMITYTEVFGKQPVIGDLQTILSKYRRIEITSLLAKINCMLGTWKNEPDFELDAWLCGQLMPRHKNALDTIRRKSSEQRIVFSRLPLLYAVKQGLVGSDSGSAMPNTPAALEEVGVVILMANDLVLPSQPERTDSTLGKLTNLLPFTDYVPQDEYTNDIARSLLMFEEIAATPTVKEAGDYIDLPELFLSHMGISLREFCELVFGAATRYLVPKTNELLSSPEALLLRPAFFRTTRISPEKVHSFFSKVALPEDRYGEELKRLQERPGDDFTVLQRFSFLEVLKDVFVCVDPGFLVEKAGRGLYWTFFAELPNNKEREKLAAFWGRLFEEYGNRVQVRALGRFQNRSYCRSRFC
jgi:hypothetical protein